MYTNVYYSPIGKIYLQSDGKFLTGLSFENKYHDCIIKNLDIFDITKKWLNIYFDGKIPDFFPKIKLISVTKFRRDVLNITKDIPYGKTIAYSDITKQIIKNNNIKNMSSQAVGSALKNNPICIIIPCHRVISKNGKLTGYAYGIDKKKKLLDIENNNIKRCSWCNLNNKKYIDYHDNEWGVFNCDDKYLLEMLILEMFQAGLSWECILNKRESFRESFDNFNIDKICLYDNNKIEELLNNKNIIRNRLKINASINNAKIFKNIVSEYGSFYNYLKTFTHGKIIYEINKTTNTISDNISENLKYRGMKFVGSTTIYAYLQAIGVIYSHESNCYLNKPNKN